MLGLIPLPQGGLPHVAEGSVSPKKAGAQVEQQAWALVVAVYLGAKTLGFPKSPVLGVQTGSPG